MPWQHRVAVELVDTAGRTYLATFTPDNGPGRPWAQWQHARDAQRGWTALAAALTYLDAPRPSPTVVDLVGQRIDQPLTRRWTGAVLHPVAPWWQAHTGDPWRNTGRHLDGTGVVTFGTCRGPRQRAATDTSTATKQPLPDPNTEPTA